MIMNREGHWKGRKKTNPATRQPRPDMKRGVSCTRGRAFNRGTKGRVETRRRDTYCKPHQPPLQKGEVHPSGVNISQSKLKAHEGSVHSFLGDVGPCWRQSGGTVAVSSGRDREEGDGRNTPGRVVENVDGEDSSAHLMTTTTIATNQRKRSVI